MLILPADVNSDAGDSEEDLNALRTKVQGLKKLSLKGLTSFYTTPTFPLSFLRVNYPLQNEIAYTVFPGPCVWRFAENCVVRPVDAVGYQRI
jgi:hypothetical protein